jgi:ribosomal protein S18 acetylase RimI-like enzyme
VSWREQEYFMSHQSFQTLRPFLPDDAPSVIAWYERPRSLWVGPFVPGDIERWHADPDVHPYMLCTGRTPVGYGELWVDPVEEEVELARLIVAPEHRGQGLGVILVRLLLEQARHTPYSRVFLRVLPDNAIAIGCYRKAGFTPVSPAEQQSFNKGQPQDYLWMGYLFDDR